jgi:hypothetical protein
MIGAGEATRALGGAVRLFVGDPAGMRAFDLSTEGFFRSFRAIVLVVPLYAIVVAAERKLVLSARATDVADAAFVLSRFGMLALDWILFPLVMAFVARAHDLGGRYAAFVVAHNWASVVGYALNVPPSAAYGLGLIGATPALLLHVVVLAVVLRYGYVVARTALGAPPAAAAGVVALDFLLGLLLGRAAVALAGV